MRFVVLMLLFASSVAGAGELSVASGPQRVALLEVYTSEGCSSCPPADRWLGTLTGHEQLFDAFIPVAFHVDYWDYIGWKDRFASPAFADRQRTYAREGRLGSVYTPGFVYDGQEWREFFGGDTRRFPDTGIGGRLSLNLEGDQLRLDYEPPEGTSKYLRAHIALLGFGLESVVTAGENRRKTLKHDFVVLNHVETRLITSDHGYTSTIDLPKSALAPRKLALVAWVSSSRQQAPLQAVGSYLP